MEQGDFGGRYETGMSSRRAAELRDFGRPVNVPGHSRSGRASTRSDDVRYAAESGVSTRYDKRAANHLAFAKLASIQV
jgi:hypothetical protein